MRTLALAAALALAGAGGAAAQAPAAAPERFTNPLLPSGADPWITQVDGTYYYTHTLGDRIQLWKTRDVARLKDAPSKVVWRAPVSGPNSKSIWAPELHRIAGRWYLYYSASDRLHDDDAHRRVFVLENGADDPLTGTWTDRGPLATRHAGIDGSVFRHRDRLYFLYSAYVGPDSHLMLAPMANPWTLAGGEVDLARPTHDWEKQGGRQILEGPEFLVGPTGRMFIAYSASACWSDDYALGLLEAAPGADVADPAAWTKHPQPVFRKAPGRGVYAPGHNGFFKSPDGREDWIVYHANAAPGLKCGAQRSPRIQRFGWTAEGRPDFGVPVASGAALAPPSGR